MKNRESGKDKATEMIRSLNRAKHAYALGQANKWAQCTRLVRSILRDATGFDSLIVHIPAALESDDVGFDSPSAGIEILHYN